MNNIDDLRNLPRPKRPRNALRTSIQFLGDNGVNHLNIEPLELLYEQDTPREDRMVPDLPPRDKPIAALSGYSPRLGQVEGKGMSTLVTLAVVGAAGWLLYQVIKKFGKQRS